MKKMLDVYANELELTNSPFDFCTTFGIENIVGQNEREIKELVRVRMSPQMAKLYMKLLNNHIQKYEQDFGEIHIPFIKNADGGNNNE